MEIDHITDVSPLPIINQTNKVCMAGDVIYIELDGCLRNWNTYGFQVEIDEPGTKVS